MLSTDEDDASALPTNDSRNHTNPTDKFMVRASRVNDRRGKIRSSRNDRSRRQNWGKSSESKVEWGSLFPGDCRSPEVPVENKEESKVEWDSLFPDWKSPKVAAENKEESKVEWDSLFPDWKSPKVSAENKEESKVEWDSLFPDWKSPKVAAENKEESKVEWDSLFPDWKSPEVSAENKEKTEIDWDSFASPKVPAGNKGKSRVDWDNLRGPYAKSTKVSNRGKGNVRFTGNECGRKTSLTSSTRNPFGSFTHRVRGSTFGGAVQSNRSFSESHSPEDVFPRNTNLRRFSRGSRFHRYEMGKTSSQAYNRNRSSSGVGVGNNNTMWNSSDDENCANEENFEGNKHVEPDIINSDRMAKSRNPFQFSKNQGNKSNTDTSRIRKSSRIHNERYADKEDIRENREQMKLGEGCNFKSIKRTGSFSRTRTGDVAHDSADMKQMTGSFQSMNFENKMYADKEEIRRRKQRLNSGQGIHTENRHRNSSSFAFPKSEGKYDTEVGGISNSFLPPKTGCERFRDNQRSKKYSSGENSSGNRYKNSSSFSCSRSQNSGHDAFVNQMSSSFLRDVDDRRSTDKQCIQDNKQHLKLKSSKNSEKSDGDLSSFSLLKRTNEQNLTGSKTQQSFRTEPLRAQQTLSLEEREKYFWEHAAQRSTPFVSAPLPGDEPGFAPQTNSNSDKQIKSKGNIEQNSFSFPVCDYEKPMSEEEVSHMSEMLHQKLEKFKHEPFVVSMDRNDPNSPLYSITSFKNLRLKEQLLKALYKMDYHMPSKIQEAALPLLLVEPPINMIAQSQSGTGKTATFVLAMLSRIMPQNKWPQSLCLAPTYELALQIGQVVEKLAEFLPEIRVKYAVRGEVLSRGEKIEEQIIVGTPGKMLDWVVKYRAIDLSKIICFILDEADVMITQQGHQEQSIRLYKELEKVNTHCQSLLFSATFDENVRLFADSMVKDAINITLRRNEQTLSNIKQFYVKCANREEKYQVLMDIYGGLTIASAIIFCYTRKSAEWIADRMKERGHEVVVLHGDLSIEERAWTIRQFKDNVYKVLVTTNVCARGIDVTQVSMVVNYDPPVTFTENPEPDFKTYLHRIGRAGRFGKAGIAINLVSDDFSFSVVQQFADYFGTTIHPLDTKDLEQLEALGN